MRLATVATSEPERPAACRACRRSRCSSTSRLLLGTIVERRWRPTATGGDMNSAEVPSKAVSGDQRRSTATRAAQLSRRRSRVRVPSLSSRKVPANWHLLLIARTAKTTSVSGGPRRGGAPRERVSGERAADGCDEIFALAAAAGGVEYLELLDPILWVRRDVDDQPAVGVDRTFALATMCGSLPGIWTRALPSGSASTITGPEKVTRSMFPLAGLV